MGEFYKPWRRKTGCVTLASAVLLMARWARLQFYRDAAYVKIGSLVFSAHSTDGFTWLNRQATDLPMRPFYWHTIRTKPDDGPMHPAESLNLTLRLEGYGFDLGIGENTPKAGASMAIVRCRVPVAFRAPQIDPKENR